MPASTQHVSGVIADTICNIRLVAKSGGIGIIYIVGHRTECANALVNGCLKYTLVTAIVNLFSHTRTFPEISVISSSVEVEGSKEGATKLEGEESEMVQELRAQLDQTFSRDLMANIELINPIDKDEIY